MSFPRRRESRVNYSNLDSHLSGNDRKKFLKKFIGGIVNNNKGFTVIEFLATVAIVILLIAIFIPGSKEKIEDFMTEETVVKEEFVRLQEKTNDLEEQIFILEKRIEDYQKKN
ncbi:TPA: hypothetical protein DDY55_00420 [Candidatus Falkowbacteria bacterium]|nr:hypothetical protein [Candidatus Falkowbacteria bacterium]HAY12314.1 hypothetical protein [Candidatus Falkowbacteria bacterium]HBI96571.1 hypothetical protein [Candidatus Falkowbacteria bacterium]HBT27713.1 hypothetical protein [Candidatus Falkowbacteria bacterium]HBY15203.1 hypothetical protein [Candidatus Falkowbacteria bacterium]